MIEYTLATGDTGILIVQDNTDGTDKTVNMYIQSTSTKAVPQLPYSYSIDGVSSGIRQFNFTDSVLRQHLGLIFVGQAAQQFTLHLDASNTTQLGGPTDLTITLNQAGVSVVNVKVGDTWKKAVPYVNVSGVWKPATAYVMSGSTWKNVS